MGKLNYTVADFVLDPDFRKWVLSPDETTNIYWGEYLEKNPSKWKALQDARLLVLSLARERFEVSEDVLKMRWRNISNAIEQTDSGPGQRKTVPIHSLGTLKDREFHAKSRTRFPVQFFWLLILVVVFSIATLLQWKGYEATPVTEVDDTYEEHIARPGVKVGLTLHDGSKVLLNSGSTLRYISNFEKDRRELFLTGEAFFEVTKDSLRPFVVKTSGFVTRALGTSFLIKAINKEETMVALISGKVAVESEVGDGGSTTLLPGFAYYAGTDGDSKSFDPEIVLAWTRKTIRFEKTPMLEVIRVLENWYGVQISYPKGPATNLKISGKFHDQTLENVLRGMSYTGRFDFEINQDNVTLTFKN
ncbi:FecR family protein [Lunatibacter salilacus]|uniref:FecR family protein n=1 Tax=Lunatibacter salilacus TaxID=2483804 RepID=UPI00131CBF77|nr:FecR domain-containing protein [Lunatibacter salilacus]